MDLKINVGKELCLDPIFDNLKEWLRPTDVAELLGFSVRTIYDWHQRPHRSKAPMGLTIKFNRQLYVRTHVLRSWIERQNQK